jgi:hypothetical protein
VCSPQHSHREPTSPQGTTAVLLWAHPPSLRSLTVPHRFLPFSLHLLLLLPSRPYTNSHNPSVFPYFPRRQGTLMSFYNPQLLGVKFRLLLQLHSRTRIFPPSHSMQTDLFSSAHPLLKGIDVWINFDGNFLTFKAQKRSPQKRNKIYSPFVPLFDEGLTSRTPPPPNPPARPTAASLASRAGGGRAPPPPPSRVFLRILWCRQSGDHPENDLAKFGYILSLTVPPTKTEESFYILGCILEVIIKTWRFGWYRENDNHPYEELAKSGYKLDMKYRTLIILLYFWLHTENQIYKSGEFY